MKERTARLPVDVIISDVSALASFACVGCVCVCVYACMRLCTQLCMHVFMCVYVFVCDCVCL